VCFLQASIGIAKLMMMAMKEQGLTEQQALSKIWMVDSKGLIVKVSALPY
jgi:malate dehydrogenase (oxaloacetate-decarboxylating)(NADP+)